MKLVFLLSLITFSTLVKAVGVGMTPFVAIGGKEEEFLSFVALSSTTSAASSAAVSPLAGLIVFLDNGQIALDMENESLQDELDLIEVSIEEGLELTDIQKAIIHIGQQNNQL